MIFLMGLVGIIMLVNGGDDMNKHVQPSSIIEVSVGGLLLVAALVGWLIGRED